MHKNPYLLAIGGGMELSERSPLVKKFIELAGGKRGIITILPTASDFGDEVGKTYKEFFKEFCDDVEYYMIEERADTSNEELLTRLSRSTAIFFTGGNQVKITSLLGGSPVMTELRNAMKRNIIIAGTSAGASAMSNIMIAFGDSDKITKGQLHLSSGMGLLHGMVIDSHFIKRGRVSRLLHLVAQHPGTLGVGLAEDTGCLFEMGTEYFEVIGSRNVIIVNGRGIEHTNIAEIDEHQPYSVTNVRLDALTHGYLYNYKKFEVIVPEIGEKHVTDVAEDEISELPYRSNLEMSN